MDTYSRVLIIGLDGAPLELLRPWMEQGQLPNLAAFLREGVVTELESVVPPQTASGWSAMVTGKNPGKFGIFGFFRRDPKGYDLIPINSSDRKSLDIWEIVSRCGKKAGVVDVPITYPIRKINGFIISGMMTPYGVQDYFYPENLMDELSSNVGKYSPPYTVLSGKEDLFLRRLDEHTENHAKTIQYLLQHKEWDFFMAVFQGTDRIQHTFWKYMDPESRCDPKKRAKYRNAILDYYRKMDSYIGEFVKSVDENTTIFIVSDHGAERLDKWFYPNVFLLQEGLLRIRRGVAEQMRYLLFRLGLTPLTALRVAIALNLVRMKSRLGEERTRNIIGTFFTSIRDVDWAKSKAFSVGGGWGRVFINLKGRFPHGIIEPGQESETLISDIVQRLNALKDPLTGEKLCSEVYRKEEVYQGPYLAEAPDVLYRLQPHCYSFPSYEFGSNKLVSGVMGWSGDHTVNGILMMKGRNVKSGSPLANAKITDVAPTVLALMGLAVPSDMDGRILTDVLTPEFLETSKITRTDYETQAVEEHEYSDEEIEELKRNLKNIGYL